MKTYLLDNQEIHTGALILVNAEYGYREMKKRTITALSYTNTLIQIDAQAADFLSSLMKKIGGCEEIVPVSGWRSSQEQQAIWDTSLSENGKAFTEKFVARPGHSEHQTGLAIDLALKQDQIDFICPEFPDWGVCGKFRENASDFGFIERYPAGKESITRIGHEPWHFRYVGTPHAKTMENLNVTLEEYINFLRDYPYDMRPYHSDSNDPKVEISYLEASRRGITPLMLHEKSRYSISGNNIDGFIITEWRNAHE